MYDIIFIGTDTNYSRRAFKRFQNRFPLAKSVFENDVQKAFVLARKKVFTKMYSCHARKYLRLKNIFEIFV